jgi:acyl carrier protein
MTDDDMIALFAEAMREVVDEVPDTVGLDDRIADLGVDSLSLVEIVMIIEERLDVATESEDFDGVTTVGEALAVFKGLVGPEPQRA